MKLFSIVLCLASLGVATSTDAASTSHSGNKITMDATCFRFGEPVHVTFTTSEMTTKHWVGIYRASDDLLHSSFVKPRRWLWVCDAQDQWCETPDEVTFNMKPSKSTSNSPKLAPGVYKLQSHGIGHFGRTSTSTSETFTVKEKGEFCVDDESSNIVVPKSNLRTSISPKK
jgi:hypothetical protein